MPANTVNSDKPIFPSQANRSIGVTVPAGAGAANTALDGTGTLGTNVFVVLTAHATVDTRVDFIRCRPLGSTGAASVARFYLNNGGPNTDPVNNSFIADVALPNVTISQTAALVAANAPNVDLDITIPNGWRLLVSVGTALVGNGWRFTPAAGDY